MYYPSTGRTAHRYRDPPKAAVSLALAALTVGVVGFLSAVAAAPAVVGAFGVGAATTALVTFIARTSGRVTFANSRHAERPR